MREQLLEIAVEQLRTIRENRQRRIRPHGTEWLYAVGCHWHQNEALILKGVTKCALLTQQRVFIWRRERGRFGQIIYVNDVLIEPLPVRFLRGDAVLDFLIGDDSALLSIHEQHAPRLEAAFGLNTIGIELEHADFGGQHQRLVLGKVVP